mgnify:CR=1 FL=1
MKKNVVLCVGVCAALALTGCKSSESAYKKAYLKAQAQQENNLNPSTFWMKDGSFLRFKTLEVGYTFPHCRVYVSGEKPVSQTTVVDNTDNAAVRSESVTLVSGAGLKNYSVVVGSFSLKANAEGLQGTLKSAGYDAQIVYNPSNNFYRVVAATFDLKSDAVSSRDQFRSKYPDAWLLFKK